MSKLSVDDQTEHERAARAARSDLFAEEDHAPVEIRLVDLPGLIALWSLAIIVFLQFFTRYVLNDSFGWTEEAARYFLIGTTFVGGGMVCRRRATGSSTSGGWAQSSAQSMASSPGSQSARASHSAMHAAWRSPSTQRCLRPARSRPTPTRCI